MSNFLVKKVKVPVNLDGVETYFFYSFACGQYLGEKYGTPQKADSAFFRAIFKTDEKGFIQEDGAFVPKGDADLLDKEFFDTLENYVHALTLTWARETGKQPVSVMDLSIDAISAVITGIASAIGIAMPKAEEGAKADPQEP